MTIRIWTALFAAAALVACGDDADEPTDENLSGFWQATRAEFVTEAPVQSLDLVAEGWTVTLNLNDAGPFVLTATPPAGDPEVIVGTWSYTSDTVTLQPEGASFAWVFDLDLGDDRMTLGGASVAYDIDDDEVDEETTLTLALVRD
jgi:hypothetical protein